jgi:hypothetical protein
MVVGLLHESELVDTGPQEVSQVFFYRLMRVRRKDAVEITLPTYNAGGNLVNQALFFLRKCMAGKTLVDGLVKKGPIFDFRNDGTGEITYGTTGFIVYKPYPPVS